MLELLKVVNELFREFNSHDAAELSALILENGPLDSMFIGSSPHSEKDEHSFQLCAVMVFAVTIIPINIISMPL